MPNNGDRKQPIDMMARFAQNAAAKQQMDELLRLRQQNAGFAKEKDNMLLTIAILVDRLGGQAAIGKPEWQFCLDWAAGKIVLDAEQNQLSTTFKVRRVDVQVQEPAPTDGSPEAAPGVESASQS